MSVRCVKNAENLCRGDRFEHPSGVHRAEADAYRENDGTGEFIEVPVYAGGFVGFQPGARVRVLEEADCA